MSDAQKGHQFLLRRYSHEVPFLKTTATFALTILALALAASPAFANTSNWSFTAPYYGRRLDGAANGVFHTMTAGQLTLSGSIWVTMIQGGVPNGMQSWTFQVYKENGWFDQLVCTSSPVTPNTMVGQQYAVSFTTNCGNISAGQYYLVIWRANSDNREIQGAGTLHTP